MAIRNLSFSLQGTVGHAQRLYMRYSQCLSDDHHINVTWHISFSGVSPVEATLADLMAFEPVPGPEGVTSEDRNEFALMWRTGFPLVCVQSVLTKCVCRLHRGRPWTSTLRRRPSASSSSTNHPRVGCSLLPESQSPFLISSSLLFPVLESTVDAYYWYTRRTTAGICLPAAYTKALTSLVEVTRSIWVTFSATVDAKSRPLPRLLFLAAFQYIVNIDTCIMVYTLLSVGFVQLGPLRYVPSVWRKNRPNHQERASERLDNRTSIRTKAMAGSFKSCELHSLFTFLPRLSHSFWLYTSSSIPNRHILFHQKLQ
jgi:hypothetical protein